MPDNHNNNNSNTTDHQSGYINSILNVHDTARRPGKRKFSENGNREYNGHSSFNSLDSSNDVASAAFRHRAKVSAPGQIPKKQSSWSNNNKNNSGGTATNAKGKISRKIDSPESKNKKPRLEASSLIQFYQPLPELKNINKNPSSSHHPASGDIYSKNNEGSNNVRNYGSASKFPQNGTNHKWREIPPGKGEPHSKTKNGILFHWCIYCNNESGFWTTHKSNDWTKHPPKPGEPDEKIVERKTFVWCQKCQNGSGCWGGHKTSRHRDTTRDRKMRAQTWDSNNEVSTRSESRTVKKYAFCVLIMSSIIHQYIITLHSFS